MDAEGFQWSKLRIYRAWDGSLTSIQQSVGECPVSQIGTLRCRDISEVAKVTYVAKLAFRPSLSAQSPCLLCFLPSLIRAVSRATVHLLNPNDASE